MNHKWQKLLLICRDINVEDVDWKYSPTVHPNIGLEYIYSNIKDLITTKFLDLRLFPYKKQDKILEDVLSSFHPDLVGIFSITPYIRKVQQIAKICKKYGSEVIIGGWHPTLYPIKAIRLKYIDYIVRGEGEQTLRELIIKEDPEGIKGISYKDKGKIIHNPDRPLEQNLDNYRYPSRHNRKGLFYRASFKKIDAIITSRGCTHQCSFCPIQHQFNRTWRTRSIADVMNELEDIRKINYTKNIAIFDDNFTADPIRVKKFCEEVIKRDFSFSFNCLSRADFVANNPDLIKLMRKAGFWGILIGFETFKQYSLDIMNKHVKLKTYIDAIRSLRENNILIIGTFLIGGSFNEKREDVLYTLKLIKKLGIDMIFLYYTIPIPNTKLLAQAKKRGLLLEDRYEICNMIEPVFKTEYLEAYELKELMEFAHSYNNDIHKIISLIKNIIKSRGIGFFLNISRFYYLIICLPRLIFMKMLKKFNKKKYDRLVYKILFS